MKKVLFATATFFALTVGANAAVIETFGQTGLTNKVVATDNGTTTTININNDSAQITGFAGGPIVTADFTFSATSIDPVTTIGTALLQHYNGNFCFTSGDNCTGTNYLSGIFVDAAFGGIGGPGLVVNANNPPDTLTLTSSVIPADQLQPPDSFNITFTNLTPPLHVDGTTIAAFTASYAGNVSASEVVNTTEPASLAILGVGLLGVGFIRHKYRKGNENVASFA